MHPVGGVVGDQPEEAAVSGVDVDADPVLRAQRDGQVDRVDRAEPGGAGGHHHGPDRPGPEQILQCVQVHPAGGVGGHGVPLDAEQVTHPGVGVVGVGAVGDAFAGVGFPGYEQGFQVRDGAAAGEMTEEFGAVPEHVGKLGDDLLLHLRGGRPAVQRVVVRVDEHGGDVPDHRDRVRWLEHLPGVAGVEERVILAQPAGQLGEGGRQLRRIDLQRGMRLIRAELPHPPGDLIDREGQVLPQLAGRRRAGGELGGRVGHGHRYLLFAGRVAPGGAYSSSTGNRAVGTSSALVLRV